MALPRSPYRLAIALSLALLAAIAALVQPTPSHAATAPCAASDVAASNTSPSSVGRAIRCLVNAQRAAHGLGGLRASRQLRIAAENHGSDMVSHRFFAHVSPLAGAITDRARSAGYLSRATDAYVLGEDIAWGEGDLSTPAAIVTAWMNSPAHRAVILDRDFRDVGVGVVEGVPVESALAGATFVLDVGAK